MLVHASLFSGIGGFDLAADWMGWDNLFHCEWNPFGQRVLKHHFPKSISYNDITKTDFSIHERAVDILTGGFPCQPYSTAGKRLGKADERHLFPHMLRCIKEVKPRWVVGENVRGLVNWNGGLVFNEVYDDLEREGYEVQSFLIPAAGVNAPHQRYRIWFVAFNSKSNGSSSLGEICKGENFKSFGIRSIDEQEIVAYSNHKGRYSESSNIPKKNEEISERNKNAKFSDSSIKYATNSTSIGLCGNSKRERSFAKTFGTQFWMGKENVTYSDTSRIHEQHNPTESIKQEQFSRTPFERRDFSRFPTKSAVCGRNDGIPRELDSITFSKWRNESIKAYGNAIVPQVAYQIFKAIEEFELMVNK